jgi:hypothetical protein
VFSLKDSKGQTTDDIQLDEDVETEHLRQKLKEGLKLT